MVGALAAVTGLLPLEVLVETVERHMPSARRAMVFPNQEALRRGAQIVMEQGQIRHQIESRSSYA
ncbi:MAG: hypothetical protein DDG58_11685 [Ardenticatenia bacterium]|nr:MAG: hypothetical protein DDG58_11685 [Ardenticatenia bacterium]